MISITDLRSCIGGWSEVWRHANLWHALQEDLPVNKCVTAFIRDLAEPRELLEIPEYLLATGAYRSVAVLLETLEFLEATPGIDVHYLELELTRRRIESQARVLSVTDELVSRSERAGAGITRQDPRFQEAYRLSVQDDARSLEILSLIRSGIEDAERRVADKLYGEIRERFLHMATGQPGMASWKAALDRAVREKHFDLVRLLLAADPGVIGQHNEERVMMPVGVLPFRGSNTAEEVCRWSLDGEGGPPEFYSCWDPLRGGVEAKQLLEVLRGMCSGFLNISMATAFVSELERLLGWTACDSPELTQIPGGFTAKLTGLNDITCPGMIAGGVRIYLPIEWEIMKSNIADNADLAVIFWLQSEGGPDGNRVFLTSWDILQSLARPSAFRVELLRIISAQLSPEVFPVRAPSNWSTVGREADIAAIIEQLRRDSVILMGPRGIGKAPIANAVIAAVCGEGWTCQTMECPLQVLESEGANVRDAATKAIEEASPVIARHVMALDEVPITVRFLYTADDLLPSHLDPLFAWVRQSPASRRVLLCGWPLCGISGLASGESEKRYQLDLVPFGRIRCFAEKVLYTNGYQLAHAFVLDRIAYFAAGRFGLLYAFLRSLFVEFQERALPRTAAIDFRTVEHSSRRREYRDVARRILLGPVEADPILYVTFAASLVAFGTSNDQSAPYESATIGDVADWLSSEDILVSSDELRSCVDRLATLGLLHWLEGSRVALMPGGGDIVLSIVGDRQQYFAAAKANTSLRSIITGDMA